MNNPSLITEERKSYIEHLMTQLSYAISRKYNSLYLNVGPDTNVHDEHVHERYIANMNAPVIKNSIVASFYNTRNFPNIELYAVGTPKRFESPNDLKLNVIYDYRAGDIINFSCTRSRFEDAYSDNGGYYEVGRILFDFRVNNTNLATLVESFDRCYERAGDFGARRKSRTII